MPPETRDPAMASTPPIDADAKALHPSHDTSQVGLDGDSECPTDDAVVDANLQHGVQNIEAITLSWPRAALMVAFVLIWLVYFFQALVAGISSALIPHVTSDFAMHSLTPTTSVLSSVVGGITNLSIAKTLDIFGRPQGFLFCVILATFGLIISAACNNVEAYAASQVFYTVGTNGVGYSLSVFIADTTSLRHRGLIQSLCGSPSIITAWLGGPISTSFLHGPGWRWAFGVESIIVPAVSVPLFGLFMHHYSKAKSQGLVPKRESKGAFVDQVKYYAREFDIHHRSSQPFGWRRSLPPAFQLVRLASQGVCISYDHLLLRFRYPPPHRLWYLGEILCRGFLYTLGIPSRSHCRWGMSALFHALLSYTCWGMYFGSILQAVNNLSVTNASYVMSTYSVGGFLFAIFVGTVMSYTGNFKAITLYVALLLAILGSGLMAYFRHADQSIGYIVMCQLFIAFGSGTIMITAEIAILAAIKEQQYFAIAIALVSMCSNIGQVVGLTVSAAIWQHVIPKKLADYLPAEELPNLPIISMDIVTQLSYPVGSPTRMAIQHAYGDAHRYLFIAGTAAWALGVVAVVMWRNINIINIKQTKGRVV
ncbi:hypothetical protein FZEAL_10119 [Fusarium zealandicum]|uniref:Major facilitator superfamily (MFS) profile domain-containing protein n=1 Tax=Fusarium zealandicum TaxID=1053134 RepID=A0A8H4U5T2_9HYPO|nr:hypothetical protein FZEAL_10119 [Fusarium zealandicum]